MAVPWLTVLLLAAVMAFGDGFWVVSLRGVVGAVERTDSPFTSWLRESTLLLPFFAAAVVGALMVALHWFGPTPLGVRHVTGTALLVAAAGSVAGTAWLWLSAAYDYWLQSSQSASMSAMGHSCGAACLARMQAADVHLQVRGGIAGAALILLTNLILVTWMVLLLGGRLRAGKVVQGLGRGRASATRAGDWRLLLVTALLGSSLIHAAVVPEHLNEWPLAGLFFVALTWVEVAMAILVWSTAGAAAEERWVSTALGAVAVASVGTLVLWAFSRTWGLPFGPEAGVPEPVGLADCAATLLEVLTLIAALVLLRGRTHAERGPLRAHHRAVLVLALLAVTSIGCGGSALSVVHQFGVEHAMHSSAVA